MNLCFDTPLVDKYTSLSQKIRVLTERWVDHEIYCPNCGQIDMSKYANNRPVADFFCGNCKEEYELKSKKNSMGNRIVDGAYSTMIQRLIESNNPNFFLLNYDVKTFEVLNFMVIPKHFFVPEIIEKRKPLSMQARRAGWTGCNILMHNIPQTGKIFYVKNKIVESKENVISEWRKTLFLREEKEVHAKGWILDIMSCIDRLNSKEFTLDAIYSFENELKEKHPDNNHIKDKIRQQLQVLRDKGYLKFIGRGHYKI